MEMKRTKMVEAFHKTTKPIDKQEVSAVASNDRVMCASCRKECSEDDLHEVTGTTTLSKHTMTVKVCDDCDPQDVKTEKHT